MHFSAPQGEIWLALTMSIIGPLAPAAHRRKFMKAIQFPPPENEGFDHALSESRGR
jgi:hypothetical protein